MTSACSRLALLPCLAAVGSLAAATNIGCSSDAGANASTNTDALSGWTSWAFEGSEVPVCWEAAGWDDEKAIVRAAVADTWGQLDLIRFVGWDQCTPQSNGIRIEVAEKRAFANALGKNLLGMPNGLTLNFAFEGTYAPECSRNTAFSRSMGIPDLIRNHCIHIDAVHEFGHVLGFAHEQNRPDRPAFSCSDPRMLTVGREDHLPVPDSTFGTGWDFDSVMNYCNIRYWERGYPGTTRYGIGQPWPLSPGDREGMRKMYGQFRTQYPTADGTLFVEPFTIGISGDDETSAHPLSPGKYVVDFSASYTDADCDYTDFDVTFAPSSAAGIQCTHPPSADPDTTTCGVCEVDVDQAGTLRVVMSSASALPYKLTGKKKS